MKNFISNGKTLLVTVPAGGLLSGQGYLVGTKLVVCVTDGAEGDVIAGNTSGEYELPKEAPLVINQGDTLYWDNTAKKLTKTALGNTQCGYATAGALSADTTVKVYISNISNPVGA